jgi:hypothetical protein
VPPIAVSVGCAIELADPGLMSATSVVPPGVPSLFHSSVPCVPSFAAKKSVPPAATSQR